MKATVKLRLTASMSWDCTNSSMSWRPVTATHRERTFKQIRYTTQQCHEHNKTKFAITYHQGHHHRQPGQLCIHQNV